MDVRLAGFEVAELFTFGPFTAKARCTTGSPLDRMVEIVIEVNNESEDEDLTVYGERPDGTFLAVLSPGDDGEESLLWSEARQGNSPDVGFLSSDSGYHIGIDGDSTIGIQRNDEARLAEFGDDINCVMKGTFTTFYQKPEQKDVVLAGDTGKRSVKSAKSSKQNPVRCLADSSRCTCTSIT